jgi:hypothetical protein
MLRPANQRTRDTKQEDTAIASSIRIVAGATITHDRCINAPLQASLNGLPAGSRCVGIGHATFTVEADTFHNGQTVFAQLGGATVAGRVERATTVPDGNRAVEPGCRHQEADRRAAARGGLWALQPGTRRSVAGLRSVPERDAVPRGI